jgi:stress response protein YsnF
MNNLADNDNDAAGKLPKENALSGMNYTFSQNEETVGKIPLFAENFDIAKKTEESNVILAKNWVTSTKNIEIPVKYEEVYISDKEFDSYGEGETAEIFSKIKHKITGVFSHDEDKEDGQQQHQLGDIEIKKYKEQSNKENQNHLNGKLVPFHLDGKNENVDNANEKNIIPIWGEEIIVNKRMVKLGEIVIKKYEINEKQKIDVEVKTEKLTVIYPDNSREEIS